MPHAIRMLCVHSYAPEPAAPTILEQILAFNYIVQHDDVMWRIDVFPGDSDSPTRCVGNRSHAIHAHFMEVVILSMHQWRAYCVEAKAFKFG